MHACNVRSALRLRNPAVQETAETGCKGIAMKLPRLLFFTPGIFQKIALAFGCILMILVLLATGAALGLDRFVAKLAASQSISADVRLVGMIDRQMAVLQRQVREYIASGRTEELSVVQNSY